jgi:O-antigen/teichoic acid export membrane protein
LYCAIVYWLAVRCHPTCFFSKESFRYLFSYGSKIVASALINTLYNNIYALVIGKFYTPAQLGNYSKADKFAQFPSQNITGILQRVSFPVLSQLQTDQKRLRSGYIKFINLSAFLVFPLMMGLLALARPFTMVILTDKWENMIILLQILCLSMMWYPVHAINLNLLQVIGRSDLFLKLEIIKKIIGVAILAITLPMGILEMCIGQIVAAWINLFVNTYYSGKFLQAGFIFQMKFLLPTFFNSLIMATTILCVNWLLPAESYILQIVVGMLTGGAYYAITNYIFNKNTIAEIKDIVKKK